METIVARLKIKDGKEEEALERLRTMCAAVESDEPDALAYAAHQVKDDPTQIVFFEMYTDGAALKSHGQTEHMARFRENFGDIFDVSQLKIERMERVAGFVR